jgi:hypothetical protein
VNVGTNGVRDVWDEAVRVKVQVLRLVVMVARVCGGHDYVLLDVRCHIAL